MVVSLKANKKRVIAFLLLVIIIVGACFLLKDKEEKPEPISGATNEERIAYLQNFGWAVGEEPIDTREVMIPSEFTDVYTTYNVMQKAQGFDLKPYAGLVCTQYKYLITNYPDNREVYATMLIYGDELIGGDVACAEVDGFMHGFAVDSAPYGDKATNKAKTKEETSSELPSETSLSPENSAIEPPTPEISEVESEAVRGADETRAKIVNWEDFPTD